MMICQGVALRIAMMAFCVIGPTQDVLAEAASHTQANQPPCLAEAKIAGKDLADLDSDSLAETIEIYRTPAGENYDPLLLGYWEGTNRESFSGCGLQSCWASVSRLLLQLRKGVKSERIVQLISDWGFGSVHLTPLPLADTFVVEVADPVAEAGDGITPTLLGMLPRLRDQEDLVRHVEPDFLQWPTQTHDQKRLSSVDENDCSMRNKPGPDVYASKQAHAHKKINVYEAWKMGRTTSRQVTIAILDTGIRIDHNDLCQNLVTGCNALSKTGCEHQGLASANDDHGHGTWCAGPAGARGNNSIGIRGVSWELKLMPLKFLRRDGCGFVADAILMIQYAVDKKVELVSCSWGSSGRSRCFEEMLDKAEDILFIAAAGNGRRDISFKGFYPASLRSRNLLAVAACDNGSKATLAPYSNYGKHAVDLAAPGSRVFTTCADTHNGKCYERAGNGTSLAVPFVAGAAALAIAEWRDALNPPTPELTPAQLRWLILESANTEGQLHGKVCSGGRLDVGKLIERTRWYASQDSGPPEEFRCRD